MSILEKGPQTILTYHSASDTNKLSNNHVYEINLNILGGYYWYKTEQNKTYEQTMRAVKDDAVNRSIPYK